MFVLKRGICAYAKHLKIINKNVALKKTTLSSSCSPTSIGDLRRCKFFSSDGGTASKSLDSEGSTPVTDPSERNLINYDAITNGDKELEHKLKVIMLETEVLRQEGHAVPDQEFIEPDMWENMLGLQSRSARRKYLIYLFKLSKKKENRQAQKLERKKEYAEFKELKNKNKSTDLTIEEHAAQYGLQTNHIFLRIQDQTMNHFYHSRLMQAIQFGQKIAIDCGFDKDMTKRENINCAKQLMLLFADNRINDDPFDIHLTNLTKNSILESALQKFIPSMYEADYPLNIHEKSYTDLFPKEKLIYLTPHCREEMDTFDHEAVYIIGGIVDKVNNEPLSLAKAKREGITMKKFPLDKYLQWNSGSGKSLTLNSCMAILLDLKKTGDWKHALRNVPRRKIVNNNYSTTPYKFSSKTEKSWKPRSNVNDSRINIRSLYNE